MTIEKFDDIFNFHSWNTSPKGDMIITLKRSYGRAKRSFLLKNAHGIWERPYFRVHAESIDDPSIKYHFTTVRNVPSQIWNTLISNTFKLKFPTHA